MAYFFDKTFLEKSLCRDYITQNESFIMNKGDLSMDYDMITLVSKLRNVKNMEELSEVKELGESFVRKQKNYAILTLMAVAEEMGNDEILDSIDKMKEYLNIVLKKNDPEH